MMFTMRRGRTGDADLWFAKMLNGRQKQELSLFSSETSRERELFECWREVDLRWVAGLGQGSPAGMILVCPFF
jgi:hypothetical protein